MKIFALVAVGVFGTIRYGVAAEQCTAACADLDGESVLTIQASEISLGGGDANANLVLESMKRGEADLDQTKAAIEEDIRGMATRYAKELREFEETEGKRYDNFVSNAESIEAADTADRKKIITLKDEALACQTRGYLSRAGANTGGWDQQSTDGLMKNEGDELGTLAANGRWDGGAINSACEPALLQTCAIGDITGASSGASSVGTTAFHREVTPTDDGAAPAAFALPGATTKHYLYILEYVFPEPPFTVEGWINVANGYSGDYWFSFASSLDYGDSNSNCLLVKSKPGKYDEWVHWAMVVSATGSINHYVNGKLENSMLWTTSSCVGGSGSCLCKKGNPEAFATKGALVLGQEQDAYHGGFSASQAAKMKIDRIGVIPKLLSEDEIEAIYNGEPYAGEFHSNWKMCGSGSALLKDSGTSKQDLRMGGTVPATDDAVTGCPDACALPEPDRPTTCDRSLQPRKELHRKLVNPECAGVYGSACETVCPTGHSPLSGQPLEPYGAPVTYLCNSDGVFEPELAVYSTIRIHTMVNEDEVDAWAADSMFKKDATFYKLGAWPKPLALNKDLNDHEPMFTLQSYLDFRKIKCDVRDALFTTVGDPENPNKIKRHFYKLPGTEMALFLDIAQTSIASHWGDSLRGTEYVDIPANLCTRSTMKGAAERGLQVPAVPGEAAFEIAVPGLATFAHTTRVHCNATVSYTTEEDEHFNFPLERANTGKPTAYESVNNDPNYSWDDGWYFRPWKQDRSAWQFYRFAFSVGEITEDDGAEADGWSSAGIRESTGTDGKMHGLFDQTTPGKSVQVSKEFVIPSTTATCTISFRFWKFLSWDSEYGYMHVNDQEVWKLKGTSAECKDGWVVPLEYPFRSYPNDKSSWRKYNCRTEIQEYVVEDCGAKSPLKIGFSSNIAGAYTDESWAFSDFGLTGVAIGTQMEMEVRHFTTDPDIVSAGLVGTSREGSANFLAAAVASITDRPSCGDEGWYAAHPQATFAEISTECGFVEDLELLGP